MRVLLVLSIMFTVFVTNVKAFEPELTDEHLTIARSEIIYLGEERGDELQAFLGDLGVIVQITDTLIGLGEKIWPIVEKGKPVVHTNFTPYSVLPRINVADTSGMAFYEMYGWSYPIRKKFKIVHYNYFNAAVVTFQFSVSSQYGGKYMEKGSYLTGIMVTPEVIDVKWGFDFNAQSTLVGISNVSKDPRNPIAGATIQIDYQVQNTLTNYQKSIAYFLSGDGRIDQL